MIFRALTKDDWPWVQAKVGTAWAADTRGIVAERDGKPQAVVVFSNWTYTGVVAHIAIDNPMAIRRGLLNELFRYAFQTCDREYIMGFTPSNNTKAVKLNKKLGFKVVHVIEDGYAPGVDFLQFELRKADCKYLEKEDGPIQRCA